ncbi:ubiquitin carboxyl-terminal hydrolase 47 isoform X2 [Pleuronectes platessa]|uniref:ubiquitin carboxyl-terminal hydrolase 47 isoform X2 n=1 Tax=Pleuronectes platessa TaxID=8262 RepID=UPI00232A0F69|nr:ubiquitin carboxyl-terminal hydrolase 47 isoform X2 [Pleuronectes platessa]XP_053272165.1 ubiquitin carboxyl-terminal hydrolase 47 isoform X2 [Pleuronectes platessa]XP_053272166.1 ubiquitin carboxyl-terminal hydrolase 47 isoform X2 [Pleuronectes platessa]XP_053272167.1 ubiquitin carboxyl-terminal hydrolase 47 isoform X2 [Pleuronectes platessa]
MSSWQRNQQFFKGVSTSPDDIVYHGLFNQGATCYLNSVLQVLFMTKDFREAVERCSPHNPECIDPQLRHVFDELLKQTSNTNKIRKKLGIHTVNEQHDAAEYFEKILTLTSSEASQIFHGELTHKITCSDCLEENNTDGRFWHLALELVDSHSEVFRVVDGIKEYFRTSRLGGENQMYCDNCETKSDATMTCVMRHHPEVLTLLLKRFDFDYRYMSYVKNNRVVVVPSSLQIPENQTYELYAWVDHTGDLRGGHYTATIKSQENERWYNFDDASVTLLDNQPFQTGSTEKSQSSYLLFYKKTKTAYSDGFCQPANRDYVPNHKGCNKNRQDSGDSKEGRKHERDKRKMVKGEEEEGGKEAEAYTSAEKRELVKRIDDQNCERGKQEPVWKTPQTGYIPNISDPDHKHQKEARHRSRDHNPDCVEERRDKEIIDQKEKRNVDDDDKGGKQGKGYAGQNKKGEDERMDKDNKGRAGHRKRDTSGLKLGRFSWWHEGIKQPKKERDEKRRRGGDEAGNTQEESESDAAPQSRGEHAQKQKDKRLPGCLLFFFKKPVSE